MKTNYIVYYDTLGPAAKPSDLEAIRSLLERVADTDRRITTYATSLSLDREGEPRLLFVEVEGKVSAADFVEELYEGKHGAW
jgi:hypothetical protein